jgi:hypothetical protein
MRTRWGPNKKDKPHLPRRSYYSCNNALSKRGCAHPTPSSILPLTWKAR